MDKKFLDLIQERLNYGYLQTIDGKSIRPKLALGVPQGKIGSPYLFNIYMYQRNEYIEYDLKAFLETKNKDTDSRHGGLTRNAIRENKRQIKKINQTKFLKSNRKKDIAPLKQQYNTHIKNIQFLRYCLKKRLSIIANKANKRAIRIFSIITLKAH